MWCVLAALLLAQAPDPNAQTLTPPRLVARTEPVYPEEELHQGHQARVVLLITIAEDGSVSDAQVEQSGGARFDEAAVTAVRAWRFEAARQGKDPITVQIHVAFNFAPPHHLDSPPRAVQAPARPAHAPSPQPLSPGAARAPVLITRPLQDALPGAPANLSHAGGALAMDTMLEDDDDHTPAREVVVRARRVTAQRAAGDFVMSADVLGAAPAQDTTGLLQKAPGLYVGRGEGDAVAGQVYLRGFDAEHGQDIEFTVNGIPINQPNHIHGQGYADIGFIIPETVRTLRVTEGVYDPRQADFAVAGSADFDLGVPERGITLKTSAGSFGTLRQLVMWAPHDEPEETFGAVALRTTNGFGRNRGGMSGQALGQYVFLAPLGFRGTVLLGAHGARSSFPGVVRADDVADGKVGFYDGYDVPSANSQNGFSARVQPALKLDHKFDGGGFSSLQVWGLFQQFRVRSNFTGFRQRARQNPDWVGRGDLMEQENQDLGMGGKFLFRTAHMTLTDWLHGDVEVGAHFRSDLVTQAQALLQAPQNETWDRRVDSTVRSADLGVYADFNWHITDQLHVRGGPRANVLYYDVDDRLGNFIPAFQRQDHILGFRRTAMGLAWGPRGTLEFEPVDWLHTFVSYGEGYRSPQGRQLAEGENAPFAKVRSFEGGLKLESGDEGRLSFTTAAYVTSLSKDLAFDPEEGRAEVIGPTSRKGVVMHLVSRPAPGATASLSATYVHATLDAPPPASAGNPNPPYAQGQQLPYVPPVVIRGDFGYRRTLARVGRHDLVGRLGAGVTALSARPLPYRQWAAPVALVDVGASLRFHVLEFGFDIYNLTNSRYAALEYMFTSDWANRDVPSLVPARHTAAGAPRVVMANLTLHL